MSERSLVTSSIVARSKEKGNECAFRQDVLFGEDIQNNFYLKEPKFNLPYFASCMLSSSLHRNLFLLFSYFEMFV